MQNYNNYGNYGNTRNFGINNSPVNPANTTVWNANANGVPNSSYAGWGYQNNGYNQAPPQKVDDRIFVTGRIGADAYQLPPGVNVQILWDDEQDRFYVKGYDEKGRPRVLADKDFFDHVEQDTPQASVDMSIYATKDDIRTMISDALKKNKTPNLSSYVTTDELNKIISELCVGSGGKVIRANESDA